MAILISLATKQLLALGKFSAFFNGKRGIVKQKTRVKLILFSEPAILLLLFKQPILSLHNFCLDVLTVYVHGLHLFKGICLYLTFNDQYLT